MIRAKGSHFPCLINNINHINKSFRHVPIPGWEGFKEAVCTSIRGETFTVPVPFKRNGEANLVVIEGTVEDSEGQDMEH